MKVHEALMLGATMLKPLRGVFWTPDKTAGCALGMIAMGGGGGDDAYTPYPLVYALPREWQAWLFSTPTNLRELPCGCKGVYVMGSEGRDGLRDWILSTYGGIIVHLFNQHVCDGSWTIERLADWIKSWEPQIEAPAPLEEVKMEEEVLVR